MASLSEAFEQITNVLKKYEANEITEEEAVDSLTKISDMAFRDTGSVLIVKLPARASDPSTAETPSPASSYEEPEPSYEYSSSY